MANEEVSNIGVKLTLDASNFNAGLGSAQGKLNTLQKQAAQAASGAGIAKAGAAAGSTSTPMTVKVSVEPAQLQAALKTAATGLQSVHVPIDVDQRSIAQMRTKIIAGIGTIPVQVAATFPKSGPGSPQAIIGTVFSSMGGMSPQKGQILARQAIDQIMPKREHGGPVSAGRPVIVGERRPEVFRPGASGFIERDVQQYRRQAAQLAALEYQISQRQRSIEQRIRGGGVRGYGGKYGASRPATAQSYADYQERTWGWRPGSGERDQWFHGGPIENIRRSGGVRPMTQTPVGPRSFWDTSSLNTLTAPSYPGGYMRTSMRPEPSSPDTFGFPTHRRPVPPQRLQYWGEDMDWHRFRRGRARQDGGEVERISRDTLNRLFEKYDVPHSRLATPFQQDQQNARTLFKPSRYDTYRPDSNPRLDFVDDPWLPGGKYERGYTPRPGANEVPRAPRFQMNLAEMRSRQWRSMAPSRARGPKAAYVATHEFGHYFGSEVTKAGSYMGEGSLYPASPLDSEFVKAMMEKDLGFSPEESWLRRRQWASPDDLTKHLSPFPTERLGRLPSSYAGKRPGEAEAEYFAAVERQPSKLWTPGTRHLAGVLEGYRRANGGGVKRISSLKALEEFVAKNPGLYSRWTPSIKADMQPGASSAHLMDRRDREVGISAFEVPAAAGTPYERLVEGTYDLGPSYGSWAYRGGRREADYGGFDNRDKAGGFKHRRLWLMEGKRVGYGSDEEPVLDPESIVPRAAVSRRAVDEHEAAWRQMRAGRAGRSFGGDVTSLYGGAPEELEAAAIAHFGITDDIREAGYLTPSGKYLDFSGRHESEGYMRDGDRWVVKPQTGPRDPFTSHAYGKDYLAGQRSVDHFEAGQILPGLHDAEAVDRMKELGHIRVWGTTASRGGQGGLHTVGAELSRLPTMAQINKLVGASREAEHATLDVGFPMSGFTLHEKSFRTEWPDDPMGGKRMGSFIRQAVEILEGGFPERHGGGPVAANKGCYAHAEKGMAAKAYGDWAVGYHQLAMGKKGTPKIDPGELTMVNRGSRVLDALTEIGQTRAATATHRAFYDIERGKIEAEASQLSGVSGKQLVDVVAALSSNQPWDRNVAEAVSAIAAVQGSGKAGFANKDQLDLVEQILAGKRVTGVKRLPFADAFYDPNAFPIDRWMGRITTLGMKTGIQPPESVMDIMKALRGKDWIGQDSPQPSVRRASAYTIQELAKRRGIDPREAQAEPWGTVRDLASEAVKHFRFDTKSGLAVPRRGGGGKVSYGGFLSEVVSTSAAWARDPFLAMMAYEAAHKQGRAYGGVVTAGGPGIFEGLKPAELIRRITPTYAATYGTDKVRPTAMSLSMMDQLRNQPIEHSLMFDPQERMTLLAHATGNEKEVYPEDYKHGIPITALTDTQRARYKQGPPAYQFNEQTRRTEKVATNELDMRDLVSVHNHPDQGPMGRNIWRPSTGDLDAMMAAGEREAWVVTPTHTSIVRNVLGAGKRKSNETLMDVVKEIELNHEKFGLGQPPSLYSDPAGLQDYFGSRRMNIDPRIWNHIFGQMSERYGLEFEHYVHPHKATGRQMRLPGMSQGGPAGGGIYIVNEQGDNSEGFVAARDAHHIPKFVMDRIPGAKDGAKTGMINRPANSIYTPQQDGVIIPKWAVPYVPILHAASGLKNIHGMAVDPSDPRIGTMNTFAAGAGMTPEAMASHFGVPTWTEHAASLTSDIPRSGSQRSREIAPPQRPNLGRELQEGRAGVGKELPSRTAQGAIASVSSFLFGGVQELGQAQVRRAQAEQAYQKAFRATDMQIRRSAGVMGEYRAQLARTDLSTDERTTIEQSRANFLAKTKPILQSSLATEKERAAALEKADNAARPTTGGIIKNIGVIIASTTLYGKAMAVAGAIIEPAVAGSMRAVHTFADQLSGFGATSTRVTKGLGDQLNAAGGNLGKTFGDVGLQTRISLDFAKFLEKSLGGAVVAKAAATNQGQVSELFRASLGANNQNAASGLYGGYGGVAGTSFLGSELGGGKGFMEQIAGDVSAFAGPRGGFDPENLGRGLMLVQDQRFRDFISSQEKSQGGGLISTATDVLGTAGEWLRGSGPITGTLAQALFPKTETPTANATGGFVNPALLGKGGADVAGIGEYLGNLGEQAQRGAVALGEHTENTYQLATSQEQLTQGIEAAARSGDAYAVSMAANGVILADAAGNVATGAKDFETVAKQMAKGATIPDIGTFVQSQMLALQASFQVAAAQATHQLEIGIPGQLGMQLAAQPFLAARTGVLPPGVSASAFGGTAGGGIDIAGALAEAQAMQDELTQAGADALRDLSDWIGAQPGMEGPYNVGGRSVPAAPGMQYSSPIGPTTSGAPMGGPMVQGGQAYIGGQTFDSGQAAFDYFTGQMEDAGKAIAGWQTKILNTQTAQQWAQFNNNLRLSNRAYADALALAGRGGGGRGSNGEMGGLQRQEAMLGFMLTQKQINFQTALAGFQAPGLTSEERAARQAQAEAEARIAQQQLNIQKRMFVVGADRGVTDTGAAVKLLKQEQAAQVAIAAAQKAIAAQQLKLSQAQAKAQVIMQRAEGNFSTVLSAGAGYVAQFGGAVQTAVKVIYTSLGFTKTKGGWVQTRPLPSMQSPDAQDGDAEGYLGTAMSSGRYMGAFARGAVMTVGEAGPETVAVLRNPRAMMMGGGGMGGGGPITVNLNLTVQGDVSGDATVAKIVRAVEDSFNRKAARLGMRGFVSATGG